MLRQRALHKGMDSRRGGHHGDHARGCQPQAASLDVLNLGILGPPTWAYRGCRESCNSGTQETIPAHWNVAWSLCEFTINGSWPWSPQLVLEASRSQG